MTFNDRLIIVDCEADSAEKVIELLCDRMEKEGMVKPSFREAVLTREKDYPTGIPTGFYDVAIPHAPAGHVLHPGLAVAQLRKPVTFFSMGDREQELSVWVVILLAIQDPKAQLNLLKSLLCSFENEEAMQALRDARSSDEILRVIESLGITSEEAQS